MAVRRDRIGSHNSPAGSSSSATPAVVVVVVSGIRSEINKEVFFSKITVCKPCKRARRLLLGPWSHVVALVIVVLAIVERTEARRDTIHNDYEQHDDLSLSYRCADYEKANLS